MLSKSQIKLIKSLSQKKFRNKHQLFVVEGIKGIQEFLNSDFELVSLYSANSEFDVSDKFLEIIDEKELNKISFLKTPQKALAVFKILENICPEINDLTLILDGVRDPGNLGTIIRLCDWFGIENLICSLDTVDCYNPKVVQASMGSLARVKIFYKALEHFLNENPEIPVFGALLDGKNIYSEKLPQKAFIVMGNEANGISEEIKNLISQKITIPQFGKRRETESLNVATATSIVLSEFRRSSVIEK
ncbi:TrmH family RNA methyltransferase [Christiangramia sediminis]|uniref:RNA methyltransferase n=1 Tax=Christiangramia sediminis TaxID=2881336 RepID=A0A9X1LJE8_9FLAO|nr:RNA methyltransferase [Christiangramia sediminis]MCB7481463.1 RNA methyltransferase [Christiangramia sediminis]